MRNSNKNPSPEERKYARELKFNLFARFPQVNKTLKRILFNRIIATGYYGQLPMFLASVNNKFEDVFEHYKKLYNNKIKLARTWKKKQENKLKQTVERRRLYCHRYILPRIRTILNHYYKLRECVILFYNSIIVECNVEPKLVGCFIEDVNFYINENRDNFDRMQGYIDNNDFEKILLHSSNIKPYTIISGLYPKFNNDETFQVRTNNDLLGTALEKCLEFLSRAEWAFVSYIFTNNKECFRLLNNYHKIKLGRDINNDESVLISILQNGILDANVFYNKVLTDKRFRTCINELYNKKLITFNPNPNPSSL